MRSAIGWEVIGLKWFFRRKVRGLCAELRQLAILLLVGDEPQGIKREGEIGEAALEIQEAVFGAAHSAAQVKVTITPRFGPSGQIGRAHV